MGKNVSGEITREEINKKNEKGGFPELVNYKPMMADSIFFDLSLIDNDSFTHFAFGKKFHVVITQKSKIYYWPWPLDEKKTQPTQLNDLTRKSTLDRRDGLQVAPSVDLFSKLTSIAGQKPSGPLQVHRIFGNEKGDVVVISAEGYVFVLLVAANDVFLLEKTSSEVVRCVCFVEKSEDNKCRFFLGTENGALKFAVISSEKQGANNSYIDLYKTIYNFKVQGKESVINGIFLREKDSIKSNYKLFITVDKRLLRFKKVKDLVNLTSHFEDYCQNAVVVHSGIYHFNSLYAFEGKNGYTLSLFILEGRNVILRIINYKDQGKKDKQLPNSQEQFIYKEDFQMLEKDDPNFDLLTDNVRFHPWLLHYALILDREVWIVSTLFRKIIAKKEFKQPIRAHFKNRETNNLFIVSGHIVTEIRLINEEQGAWIHLVERGLEELALLQSVGVDTPETIRKVRNIVAEKELSRGNAKLSVEEFYKSEEPLEKVMWKLLTKVPNIYQREKAQMAYCKLILNYFNKHNPSKLGKIVMMATLLVEISSHSSVRLKRLLKLKADAPELHRNITMTENDYNEIEQDMLEAIASLEQQSPETKELLREIFHAHGNDAQIIKLAETSRNYQDQVNFLVYADESEEAVAALQHYFDAIIKKAETLSASTDHQNVFSNLMETYGSSLFVRCSKKWKKLTDSFMRISLVSEMKEEFFTKSFSFMTRKYELPEIEEIIDKLTVFTTDLVRSNQANEDLRKKYMCIESFFTNLLLINFFFYGKFQKLINFIACFEDKPEKFQRIRALLSLLCDNHQRQQKEGEENEFLKKLEINILGVSHQYLDAVELSLTHSYEDQAIKWANKPQKMEIKKKLWLKIFQRFIKDDKKIESLLNTKNCPLKISDLITQFNDQTQISNFEKVGLPEDRSFSQGVQHRDQLLQRKADAVPEVLRVPEGGEQADGVSLLHVRQGAILQHLRGE